jgi:hypothetical protein
MPQRVVGRAGRRPYLSSSRGTETRQIRGRSGEAGPETRITAADDRVLVPDSGASAELFFEHASDLPHADTFLTEALYTFDPVEDVLVVEAMAGFRTLGLTDQAEHGVVVKGLPGQAGVPNEFADFVEFSRRSHGSRVSGSVRERVLYPQDPKKSLEDSSNGVRYSRSPAAHARTDRPRIATGVNAAHRCTILRGGSGLRRASSSGERRSRGAHTGSTGGSDSRLRRGRGRSAISRRGAHRGAPIAAMKLDERSAMFDGASMEFDGSIRPVVAIHALTEQRRRHGDSRSSHRG